MSALGDAIVPQVAELLGRAILAADRPKAVMTNKSEVSS